MVIGLSFESLTETDSANQLVEVTDVRVETSEVRTLKGQSWSRLLYKVVSWRDALLGQRVQ